ncbi:site-specific DNA-methyltransferase [Candidatus Shapirobacteria bacterium]|nr:site-specific DNA-methyltransferase [Candidatus Shapirobacteria bacterium]
MGNILDNLKTLLQKDERLVSEGELLKNKIIELVLKLDKDLIKLLLSDKRMRGVFFLEIDGVLIFDKDKFIKFVSSKDFLPDSYTAFKNKIGLTIGDEFLSEKKEVVLSWPYKDCVLEGGMTKEDQKRDEVFWNQTLAPDEISRLLDSKVFTNARRIDVKGEHEPDKFKTDEKGDIKDNLIIKGNNLLALYSLKKRFAGKVKLIYIDPPYNREDENFYNDSFRHSTWLIFMKNRIEIARKLLNNDGVIFVQIDFRELAYLKVLMDEVFDRKNFIGQINWQRVPEGRTLLGQGESDLKISTEYLLVYARDKKPDILNSSVKKLIDATEKIIQQYSYVLKTNSKPIEVKRLKDSKGRDVIFYKVQDFELRPLRDKSIENYIRNYENMVQSVGIQEESTFQQRLLFETKKIDTLCIVEYVPAKGKRKGEKLRDYFIKDRKLLFAKEFSVFKNERLYREGDINDFWSNSEIQVTDIAGEGAVSLRRGKKPEELLRRVIDWTTYKDEIVLDFFMGTGTTCAVAHKMGRQYIGVEQLDYGENGAGVRLKNVINGDQTGISKSVGWKGGGDFVYLELMKWNENFVGKIQQAKTKDELKKLWEAMKERAFLSYKVDVKAIDAQAPASAKATAGKEDFADLSLEDQKRFLLECLDKNHLYVNYSEIEDEEYGVSEEDKSLNRDFYL